MTIPFLSADRLSWSAMPLHGSNWDRSKAVLKARPKILRRDDFICQGCGWRSEEFQELHHRDGDHSNYKEANLETLCPLCHQLFHPASATISGGGFMIWLPELSQAELNRLSFPLFWALAAGTSHPLHSAARSTYAMLDQRRVELESHVGRSDAASFGQMLLRLSKKDYDNRVHSMAPIKMLASPKRFQVEVDYWGAVLSKQRSPEAWIAWAEGLPGLTQPDPSSSPKMPVDAEGA